MQLYELIVGQSILTPYNYIVSLCTANLARTSGQLPRPTILERVDHSEFDPAAEVEIKAARKAIIKVCTLFLFKSSLAMESSVIIQIVILFHILIKAGNQKFALIIHYVYLVSVVNICNSIKLHRTCTLKIMLLYSIEAWLQEGHLQGTTQLSDQMLAESNMREMKEIVAEIKRRIAS